MMFFLLCSVILIFINFQGLNPGRAIAEIKKLLGGVAKKEEPGIKATAMQNIKKYMPFHSIDPYLMKNMKVEVNFTEKSY